MSEILSETIQGSVHGLISLLGSETKILPLLSTPEIRRLKRIKQLGMAAEVFPDAEHSRFAHSLGVTHIAIRFSRRLKELLSQKSILYTHESGVTEQDWLEFVIAALCHDIGHGPFSHAWEHEVIGKKYSRKAWCDSLEIEYDEKIHGTMKWHELVGQGFILSPKSGLHRNLENYAEGTSLRVAKLLLGGANQKHPFLARLLSSDLDADRCDFIVRDSTQAGVSYGHYDLDWLIDTMGFGRNEHGELVVGFKENKANRALEQVIFARHSLYEKVYFHKTVKSAEIMMGLVMRRLKHCVQIKESLPTQADCKLFEPLKIASLEKPLTYDQLLTLDDSVVWLFFMCLADEATKSYDLTLQDLASRLVNRNLFKSVEYDPRQETPEKLNRAFDIISKQAQKCSGLDREEALRYYSKIYDTDNDPLSTERKNEIYLINSGNATPLHNNRDFLPLRMKESHIHRLYVADRQVQEEIQNLFK